MRDSEIENTVHHEGSITMSGGKVTVVDRHDPKISHFPASVIINPKPFKHLIEKFITLIPYEHPQKPFPQEPCVRLSCPQSLSQAPHPALRHSFCSYPEDAAEGKGSYRKLPEIRASNAEIFTPDETHLTLLTGFSPRF